MPSACASSEPRARDAPARVVLLGTCYPLRGKHGRKSSLRNLTKMSLFFEDTIRVLLGEPKVDLNEDAKAGTLRM